MFRIGQKVRVLSHSGYEKFEPGYNSTSSHTEIGKSYVIKDTSIYQGQQILWFENIGRGLYAIDAKPLTKLERALK